MFNKLKDIENLEYRRKDQIEEIKKIEKSMKVKDIDRFMEPHE